MPLAVPAVPFFETLAVGLVGAYAGWRLKLPAGSLLVPLVLGAALHMSGQVDLTLPPWLLGLTYAALGWYVGLGFSRDVIGYAFRAIPQLLLATFLLMALCGVSAFVLCVLLGTDALTAYLATSPGGIDSVAIIAVGSHADVPMVLAVQTLRVFMVIATGAPIARFLSRHAVAAAEPPGP
jgi:membrane AbrB-like protein